jgi:hypothetical protein
VWARAAGRGAKPHDGAPDIARRPLHHHLPVCVCVLCGTCVRVCVCACRK